MQQAIPLFTILNKELQKEPPQVHLLSQKLNNFLKGIMLRFAKPEIIKEATSLKEWKYKDPVNQKSDEDLILLNNVKEFLNTKSNSDQQQEFYAAVRKYYQVICDM